jgi:uncharacterized protein (TIGR03032 family)
MKNRDLTLPDMWARHSAEWRDTAQVASLWREAANLDPRLLASRARGCWWDLISELGLTLLITREYEHLVIAASAPGGTPRASFFPVPHPSGLVVDREQGRVFLASTRNPNQVFTLKPATATLDRQDVKAKAQPSAAKPLVPVASAYYPGCLYMHDLAMIGGHLHANAVGHNAVVRLGPDGCFRRVWWPRCVDSDGGGAFGLNHIQLNSIAAGKSVDHSFFSASSGCVGRLRPGHLNYPVDGRGVIFSGRTREPICTGLTRPHSARMKGREIWVANSGYGELGFVRDGRFEVVSRLPGWTRGISIRADVAFVATSRVIPKFARYAPGLDIASSLCAVHAVCTRTGKVLGSLEWPFGNQVFAIDWMSNQETQGFPFGVRSRTRKQELALFYTFLTN